MKKAAFIIFIIIAAYIGIPFGLGLWNQSMGISGFVKLAPISSSDSADTLNTDCPETAGIEVFADLPQMAEEENSPESPAPIDESVTPEASEGLYPEAEPISMPGSEEITDGSAPFDTQIPTDNLTEEPSSEALPPEEIIDAGTPDTQIPNDSSADELSPETLPPEDVIIVETPYEEESAPPSAPGSDMPEPSPEQPASEEQSP